MARTHFPSQHSQAQKLRRPASPAPSSPPTRRGYTAARKGRATPAEPTQASPAPELAGQGTPSTLAPPQAGQGGQVPPATALALGAPLPWPKAPIQAAPRLTPASPGAQPRVGFLLPPQGPTATPDTPPPSKRRLGQKLVDRARHSLAGLGATPTPKPPKS